MMLVVRILLVTKRSFHADILSLFLLDKYRGLYLLGHVPQIHIIDQVAERSNVKSSGVESINIVIDRNVADKMFGKIDFHVKVTFKVVSSEP